MVEQTQMYLVNIFQKEHERINHIPDKKFHGANMGPTWGRQDPGGPMLAPWTLLSGIYDLSVTPTKFVMAVSIIN